jgi:carbon-monoxide dehydrogenase medium subunit
VLDQVGNPRIRASGTLAGNIVFAEPKSDVIPILSALNASVTLVSPRGSRTLTVKELMLGPYYTAREPDELLTEIRVPIGLVLRAQYLKYQTQERPTVGVAALDFVDGTRRIAVGAVSGLTHVHDLSSAETIDGFEIAEEIDVIPDSAGSIRYKRHVTGVIIDRVVAALDASEAA